MFYSIKLLRAKIIIVTTSLLPPEEITKQILSLRRELILTEHLLATHYKACISSNSQ